MFGCWRITNLPAAPGVAFAVKVIGLPFSEVLACTVYSPTLFPSVRTLLAFPAAFVLVLEGFIPKLPVAPMGKPVTANATVTLSIELP